MTIKIQRRLVKIALTTIFITIIIFAGSTMLISKPTDAGSNITETIPQIHIYSGETPLTDITDKTIVYHNNSITIDANGITQSFDDIEIKGRGNTTWINQPKKPYQIKFQEKVDLFDMGKARKYILLANAFDYAHIRNDAAFYLEHLLNQSYALKGEFVELYIDDDYRGLYYLTQKIEIGKSRIDLREPTGIIVELENMRSNETTCYYTNSNTCLSISDVVDENQSGQAIQDFIDAYNALEKAIAAKDYKTISRLIDVDSFAKYYLLSEFTVNPDAYATSFFFYKDGPEDKIHAGPGWDFDLAFCNHNWTTDDQEFYSPYAHQAIRNIISNTNQNTSFVYSNLILDLTEIPEFYARITEIYQSTLSNHKIDFINHVRKTMNRISTAAVKDNSLWNQYDYNIATSEFLDWVSKRYDYLEREFDNKIYTPALHTITDSV